MDDYQVIAQADQACQGRCECQFSFDQQIYEMNDDGNINCPMGRIWSIMDSIMKWDYYRLDVQWGRPTPQMSLTNVIYGAQEEVRQIMLMFSQNSAVKTFQDSILAQIENMELMSHAGKEMVDGYLAFYPNHKQAVRKFHHDKTIVAVLRGQMSTQWSYDNPISQFKMMDEYKIREVNPCTYPTATDDENSIVINFAKCFMAIKIKEIFKTIQSDMEQPLIMGDLYSQAMVNSEIPDLEKKIEQILTEQLLNVSHLAFSFWLLQLLDIQLGIIIHDFTTQSMPSSLDELIFVKALHNYGRIYERDDLIQLLQEWRNRTFSRSCKKVYKPLEGRKYLEDIWLVPMSFTPWYIPYIHVDHDLLHQAGCSYVEECIESQLTQGNHEMIHDYFHSSETIKPYVDPESLYDGFSSFTGRPSLWTKLNRRYLFKGRLRKPEFSGSLMPTSDVPGYHVWLNNPHQISDTDLAAIVSIPWAVDKVPNEMHDPEFFSYDGCFGMSETERKEEAEMMS